MAEETKPAAAAATPGPAPSQVSQQQQAHGAPEAAESQSATAPGGASGDTKGEVDSTAEPQEKVEAAMKGDRITVNHGEKSQRQKDLEKAQEDDRNDDLRGLPAQMRAENQHEPAQGRTVAVDGLAPHLQDFPEGEGISGGTLPPV